MSTNEEMHLLHQQDYFTIISVRPDRYEIKSNNTGHYWLLCKRNEGKLRFVSLYHKHHSEDKYHYQTDCPNILESVIYIADHDEFQLRGRKPLRGKPPEGSFFNYLLQAYY